jgi:hypothetical protein
LKQTPTHRYNINCSISAGPNPKTEEQEMAVVAKTRLESMAWTEIGHTGRRIKHLWKRGELQWEGGRGRNVDNEMMDQAMTENVGEDD